MKTTTKDPIAQKWPSLDPVEGASAFEVVARLGTFEVTDLPNHITPYLAAAAAEIALLADIHWRFSQDDATVALLRIISRAAMAKPDATGPHTQRLFDQLEQLGEPGNPCRHRTISD